MNSYEAASRPNLRALLIEARELRGLGIEEASNLQGRIDAALAPRLAGDASGWPLHIIFDGPPGHESGRFVEVNDNSGKSIRAGEWVQEGPFWALVIAAPASSVKD